MASVPSRTGSSDERRTAVPKALAPPLGAGAQRLGGHLTLHSIDRMAVEDEGEGDAVVCVHGLGGSSNTFTPLMPVLGRHRVLRVDLPGSGRSQHAEGALSIERFAGAVQGACDRLGITRAHFVGHSLGTIVCQHVAAHAPALVRSLALFGPLIAPPDAARVAMRARAAKAQAEGAAGMQDITTALLNAALSADTRQRQPLAVAYVRESLMRQDGEAYARMCLALADAQPARVDTIACPVLLVTGDEDGVAPPQAVRAMAERLHAARSTRVVVLPRCGHWTPIERVAECQAELRDFIVAQR
jgi:pimeloyl-ACP methyl ester carboxylesterase